MSFVCTVPIIASLFASCNPVAPLAVGYVEGEFVLLAPIDVSQVTELSVKRGDRVESGSVIATLDEGDALIAVAQAEAGLAQAEAQLADIKIGKRPEEIAVLEATLRSAKAQSEESARVLARISDLYKRGTATKAQLDEATTQVEVGEAAISQAEANLAVAHLPARPMSATMPARDAGTPWPRCPQGWPIWRPSCSMAKSMWLAAKSPTSLAPARKKHSTYITQRPIHGPRAPLSPKS